MFCYLSLADLISILIGIAALVFTGMSWRRQNKRDKLEEQRYQDSQRKSLIIEFYRNPSIWTISTQNSIEVLDLLVRITNDSPNAITLKSLTVFFYDEDGYKTHGISKEVWDDRHPILGTSIDPRNLHTLCINVDFMGIDLEKNRISIDIKDTLGDTYSSVIKYIDEF